MQKITKQEFEMLYCMVKQGTNSVERLEGFFEKEDILKAIIKLEKLQLIKISYRDGKLYDFMETDKGKAILIDPKYKDWKDNCDIEY